MQNFSELKNQNFTQLGTNTKLEGIFHFNGVTRIAGELKGEIYHLDGEPLVIESSAYVSGVITCGQLEVHGKIIGTIHSNGAVRLYPEAKVQGEIKAKSLTVYPGAVLNMKGEIDS